MMADALLLSGRGAMPVLLAVLALLETVPAQGQVPPSSIGSERDRYGQLFKDSRARLALELARGRPDARVLVASEPGRNADIAAMAGRIGGAVEYREDRVDYLRVRVPIQRVQELVDLEGIAAAGISMRTSDLQVLLLSGDRGKLAPAQDSPQPPRLSLRDTLPEEWPPRQSDLPLRRPYSPLQDVDAGGFGSATSPFDGRGVTVAVVDGYPDLLLPELQWAVTLNGKPTRKIADVLNATDPADPLEDRHTPQWVRMQDSVTAEGGSLMYGEMRYTAPRDGRFRIGLLNERLFDRRMLGLGLAAGDLNRDGNPAGSDSLFAVLWDVGTGEVWVDTRQNHSFADEAAMLDYGVRYDVGILGDDNTATDIRESVGFTIQTDSVRGFVSVNVGVGLHGTMTAGAVVASRTGGGRFDGVAPGARLVMVDRGRTLHGEIEAVIMAFQHPATDLVVLEQGIDPAYLPRDGSSVASIIYDRLVDLHDKLLLVPASNQPGLTTVAEPASGRRALAVNAYQSQESYFINSAIRVPERDNLHAAHSHGPGGNGRLKPDILAPSRIISIQPAFAPGGSMGGLYQLPPGYFVGGGTSTAAPVAAGAVARLISAAKLTGVPYDADRLRRSITQSARFIPSIPAHKQGHGLVQVAAAWELLRDLAFGGETVRIESRAPVRSVLSGWLTPPNEGEGIFEREGWTAGDTATRVIHLTRRTGSAGPMPFRVRWLGNEAGTFAAADGVMLPLDEEVALPVAITPAGTGVHSAILSLEDAAGRTAHRILNTIVAADTFQVESGYSFTRSFLLPRPGVRSLFLRVPSGAAVLLLEVAGGSKGWNLWFHPPDARRQLIFTEYAMHRRRGIAEPAAGVWEITVTDDRDNWEFDDSRPDPPPDTPVTIQVTLLKADVSVQLSGGADLASAKSGEAFNLSVQNRYGAFQGGLTTVPVGGALLRRREIARGDQHVYSIHVPPGSTMLRVQTQQLSDTDADVDLYLFDCSTGTCIPRKSGTGSGVDERVFVSQPAPGEWRVVVDAASVPSGGTTYDYLDVIFHSGFGTIAASDASAPRNLGDRWNSAGHVWIPCSPPGREPYLRVPVRGHGIEGQVRLSADEPLRHDEEPLDIAAAGAFLRSGRGLPDCRV